MRSLLFVPGDNAAKLAKAGGGGADALIIDLEDSVAAGRKREARETVAAFLAGRPAIAPGALASPRLYVRVNDLESGDTEADLDAALSDALSGIILPKAKSGKNVRQLSKLLDGAETKSGLHLGTTAIIVIATETPQAVLNMGSFTETSIRLQGLTWGAEDLATAIGAIVNRNQEGAYTPPFEFARSLCLFAAAAAGVQAIDTVFTDFRDLDGLKRECLRAVRDGFSAKLAIHPAQIAVINETFTPSQSDVERAHAIVAAFEAEPQAGVVSIDGRMVDRPHLRQAEQILARARRARLV